MGGIMETETQKQKRDYVLPASILVAGLLVAVALVYNAGRGAEEPLAGNVSGALAPASDKIRPLGSDDHILGNADAPIALVTFTDLECPYCKDFHATLKQTVNAYDGKVAVVYRHLPLDVLHSKARNEAMASECAAELGGSDAFWQYVDRVFSVTPSNDGLDPTELPKIAEQIGLDRGAFESCLASGRYADRIERDVQDGKNSGAEGTPYGVLIVPSGATYVVPGAFPFEDDRAGYPSIKAILDIVFEEEKI